MFNPFIPIFHFYNHWKRQKIKDFFDVLMFSGDVETKHLPWNGLSKSYKAIPSNILTREFPTFLEKQVCGKFETSYSGPYCPSMFQHRCFKVVDQCWNNVDPTLKMKQNTMMDFQCCTIFCVRRWNNVYKMVFQR